MDCPKICGESSFLPETQAGGASIQSHNLYEIQNSDLAYSGPRRAIRHRRRPVRAWQLLFGSRGICFRGRCRRRGLGCGYGTPKF